VSVTFGARQERTVPLAAGVVHNGIAVAGAGVVIALSDGSVVWLDRKPVVAQNAGFVQRVNCGGKEFVDSEGRRWDADREFAAGAWGHVGGSGFDRIPDYNKIGENTQRKTVAGPDAYLYMTELNRMSQYRFTVPNGPYALVLHFAETYFAPDMVFPNGDLGYVQRRFNVTVNGASVLRDFSPLRESGASHVPVVETVRTEVANGEIVIGFERIEASAIINAIEVIAAPAGERSDMAPRKL